jgi:hypothetical protein
MFENLTGRLSDAARSLSGKGRLDFPMPPAALAARAG